jgi:hypothetical protein
VMRQATTPRPSHTCNIFEIKGLQCTGLYWIELQYPTRPEQEPTEEQEKFQMTIGKRAHWIDHAIAPNEWRPLNETWPIWSLWKGSLYFFATGGHTPLVLVTFGETNREFNKSVVMCSQLASSKNSIWSTDLSPSTWIWIRFQYSPSSALMLKAWSAVCERECWTQAWAVRLFKGSEAQKHSLCVLEF